MLTHSVWCGKTGPDARSCNIGSNPSQRKIKKFAIVRHNRHNRYSWLCGPGIVSRTAPAAGFRQTDVPGNHEQIEARRPGHRCADPGNRRFPKHANRGNQAVVSVGDDADRKKGDILLFQRIRMLTSRAIDVTSGSTPCTRSPGIGNRSPYKPSTCFHLLRPIEYKGVEHD